MLRLRVFRKLHFIRPSLATKLSTKRRLFCTNTPSTSFASEAAAKYEKKSPTEHVLLRPDTYIGGVAMRESQIVWLHDSETNKMIPKEASYPPGLLKIFDEILVNAADNKARDPSMNRLEVWIDRESARITVWNNGKGLPVEMHPTERMYVPTLVFGNLFTSSNYDDKEIKTVGGRNGYGAKLCNIFSKDFIVETVDSNTKRRFSQRWYNNMMSHTEPKVEEVDNEALHDYTKVEFIPDLQRFHLDHLSDDIISLIEKRVLEVSATLPRDVEVFLNDKKSEIDGFEEYVKSYSNLDSGEQPESLFLHPTNRWHVGITKRSSGYGDGVLPKVISFVNNINTEKGGTHVDYVLEKIVNVIKPLVDKKLDDSAKSVKPALIKNNLAVFINCLIENPSFESQTKETLTTKPKNFGSIFECDVEKLKYWAEESGLVDEIVDEVLNQRKKKTLKRVSASSVRDIVKLEDASWAGIPGKAGKCTLILTEGDSAKALALSGLEVLGRETYGVFPLKGKLVNVSNLDELRASKNEEISSLIRILGLKFEDSSPSIDSLRYGRLLILADQDEDGSHIKGLVVNFIHKFWPSLIQSDNFVQSFRTPLLKAKKGDEIKAFFSMKEYQKWSEIEERRKWKVKYYKGLGTSTSSEAREYFSDLDHHTVKFKYSGESDDAAIRMVFDRERSDERKEWIRGSENKHLMEEEKTEISYKEFVDQQLMQFGMVDLRRSIPSLIDGLKPSQRKILWTLLNNMDEATEMKVSQLAGAVAHRQSYHHGEESLVRTIVRMGQSFCGSSNLPLLQPIGQFGTRHEGGNDAASARYIFTSLAPTTRLLFPHADDELLQKIIEEGIAVEPKWLCPIIPLILVNGSEGIGTGWSTKIANRSSIDVIDLMRRKIDSAENIESIDPFYENYQGTIEMVSATRFISNGRIKINRPDRKNASTFSVDIVELPIGVWTSKYKERLTKIVETLPVVEFSEKHTEKKVHFQLTLDRKKAARILQKSNSDLLNYFKLKTSITENRVLFDKNGLLKEYDSVLEIASEFFEVRKDLFKRRLEIQKKECEDKLTYVDNQIKFIDLVTNGTIDLRSIGREELERKLSEMEFSVDPLSSRKTSKKSDFGYLLEMPLSRLTSDEMNRLLDRKARRETELLAAESADWKSTWNSELHKLSMALQKNRSCQ